MINWNNYFDHIFVLSRCSNFERRENLNRELKRIGLYDYVTYLYQPDSKLLDYKSSKLSETVFRCKNAHYNCIKMSYELGYENILILEDDIHFLKDLEEIKNQLEIFRNLKNNVDIYLFGYIPYKVIINNKITNGYYSADCYYLNRHGMEFLIYLYENYPDLPSDCLFFEEFKNFNYFNCYFVHEEYSIGFDLNIGESTKLLPININISPLRLVIESIITSLENPYYNCKDININLYNL